MPFNTIKPLPRPAARRQVAGEMSQEITTYDPVDGLLSAPAGKAGLCLQRSYSWVR